MTYATPRTKLTWSDLAGWIKAARILDSRRGCEHVFDGQAQHWAMLAPLARPWIRGCSDAELLGELLDLLGPTSMGPWRQPSRGHRGGTIWEIVNQLTTDRLAQLAREAERDEIPAGANWLAAQGSPRTGV